MKPITTLLLAALALAGCQQELPLPRKLAVGANPESVTRGFDGDLFVSIMGPSRKRDDGDGKVVRVHGETVSDFTTGLNDPKGIVFAGGKLITADFDTVWQIDAQGKKTVLTAGMVMIVPPNVPHEFVCTEDSIDIDFFSPGRQDWMDGVPSIAAAPAAGK